MFNERWYQREAVESFWHQIANSPEARPIICLPTGAGKGVVVGHIAGDVVGWGGRIIVLTHVKELVEQNAYKFSRLYPDQPYGIYSAGLNRRDTDHAITFASIQSVYNRAELFGKLDLIFIDECHLIRPDGQGMFGKFIADVAATNPHVRVGGCTATPFRLDVGTIVQPDGKDGLFNVMAYEAPIGRLVAEGYLARVRPFLADAEADLTMVKICGGEYVESDLETAFMTHGLVQRSVEEILYKAAGRRKVLVFTCGMSHMAQVASCLRDKGETVSTVHGQMTIPQRDEEIAKFKRGDTRFMVNINVLTTGFDVPDIDCIAILRATESTGLYVQLVGRGFRVAPGKDDCLILDFGNNTLRHGPVDCLLINKDGKKPEVSPLKKCKGCGAPLGRMAIKCHECGMEVVVEVRVPRHNDKADSRDLLGKKHQIKVLNTSYGFHRKRGNPDATPVLRVTHTLDMTGRCGQERVDEWICLCHPVGSYAYNKAVAWWKARSNADVPKNINEAVELAAVGAIAPTLYVELERDGDYLRVKKAEIGPKPVGVFELPHIHPIVDKSRSLFGGEIVRIEADHELAQQEDLVADAQHDWSKDTPF